MLYLCDEKRGEAKEATMKCEGCESTVPDVQIHACAECGRKICDKCGTQVKKSSLPPEIDPTGEDDSLLPDAWLCDQCWHRVFEIEDDD